MLNTSYGFSNLLKEGYRHYAGLEEAILRNIEACKGISNITRTSYGPNGMKKLVVNHIDKIFVTNDASTILKEIDVHHPAAKLVAMAAIMQKEDYGDFTNYVVTFAGELLTQAERLIRTGLHTNDIISGYELALEKVLELLQQQVALEVKDVKDEGVVKVLESVLAPKAPTYYKFFANLVATACRALVKDTAPRFNSDNLRLVKVLGGSLDQSEFVNGFVIARYPESTGKELVEKAKVVVYNCPFDPQEAETKGTILIKNADDLVNFTKTEEQYAEKLVKGIVEAGVQVVVAGGSISEICLHYLNQYGIMVIRILSKWDVRRLCRCLGTPPVAKLRPPTPEEIGFCDSVKVREIGSTKITVFEKNEVNSTLGTIILRGSTNSIMDNMERAIENGVSAFRQLLVDGRYLNGAGSIEAFLVNQIETLANSESGLKQYSCLKYGQAFEIIPKILIDNAGLNSNTDVPTFLTKNNEKPEQGIDVFEGKTLPNKELEVYDSLPAKINAIKLATNTALTVLRVDQIIMAKPSGGPKMKDNKGWDND